MADFSIDQSSLPAVNTVCREFAVREDHSLAHTLQEQEIEHHLASNVQRNRLVQNDLQMAKKLQEEENKKAQVRLQKQQREMERRDNQMAQVIQDELTLESEKRRRQEEKDEAIARKLQEKEEKLRRKQQEVIGHEPNDVGFEENGDHMKSRVHKHNRNSKLGSDSYRDRDLRHKRDSQLKGAAVGPSSKSPIDDWATEPAAHGSSEKFHCSEAEWVNNYPDTDGQKLESHPCKKEAPRRPPPPVLNSAQEAASSYYSQGARPKVMDVQGECFDLPERDAHCWKPVDRTPHDLSPETLGACTLDPEEILRRERKHREEDRTTRKERQRAARSRSPGLREQSNLCQEQGLNPRMDDAVKETMHGISRMSAKDLEWKDAELARKLQEEEIMAIQSSKRAAQMAQDEEIAWLLMEEEKKQPHKKSKDKDSAWRAEEDRRKGSSEGRRHEQEKKHGSSEYIRPKPREGPEQLTGKPEKPGRPPTYREESTPQRPPRPASRSSESSQKVSHYRQ
ncbi:coiled-coil domain-containing protein 50 isoform X3 [Carcharodon carcharias]|uniref:coiled-coil domain-containing protein 50 isoform X3 n=1 Tax=Carcharodon carcharias TaxID=13397 RepID=UPI001B7F5089|nr:coiled-coil domain-containing protein 50 isoform X3 [Carcharodon carcharias]